MIETMIEEWAGETLITRRDRPTGAWILIAVHSSRLGPATGGTRMKRYSSLEDALADVLRLSAGMTYKYAVPGFPRGGGKAVIWPTRELDRRSRAGLLRRYGGLIRELGGLFCTGPDVGTSPEDMDTIAETGAPYVFSRTPAAGGAGSSAPFTALGLFTGIQVACERLFGDPSLAGRRVLVQGAGNVGSDLIDRLLDAGAEVMFHEIDEAVAQTYRDRAGTRFVPGDEVYGAECDVFAPCALGGILNAGTIPRLRCRAVAGGANNQLAGSGDAERLMRRGILYAPDYVVNVGGAMGITGIEAMGWSREEAAGRVADGVRRALTRVFELSASEHITTEAAARRIADERLADAV